jgi:hypothetical protein
MIVYKRICLKGSTFQAPFSQKSGVGERVVLSQKKIITMSLPNHYEVFGRTLRSLWNNIVMFFQRYRNDFFFSYTGFGKEYIMVYRKRHNVFSFCRYFLAESRLKDVPFSYSHLYTSIYKPAES